MLADFSFRELGKSRRLKSSQKCDIISTALVVVACTILRFVDALSTHHFIRGQYATKLYAISDWLCARFLIVSVIRFGQDILDSLFSKLILCSHPSNTGLTASRHAQPIAFMILAILYTLAYMMVLAFQMMTVNVAVNSYSNALLTLIISNQFLEIKGSLLNKIEKEDSIQLGRIDDVELFFLSVFVVVIVVRNLVELSVSPLSPLSVYPQLFVPLFSFMTAVAR
ncbi:hypothetical protein BGZ99_000552, partial [Dissophora globulifera]